jgi:hypothetical protein
VAFASERGVTALVEAARTAGTLDVLRTRKLAAVGPGTAAALAAHGLEPTLVAGSPPARDWRRRWCRGFSPAKSCSSPPRRRDGGPGGGPRRGRRGGGAGGRLPRAPRRLDPRGMGEVVAHPPRCVLFGSPRTVEAFLALPGAEALVPRVRAVAVGPTTASRCGRGAGSRRRSPPRRPPRSGWKRRCGPSRGRLRLAP